MKAIELQKILDDWNDAAFTSLQARLDLRAKGDPVPPEFGARVYEPQELESRKGHCHCGKFTGKCIFPDEIIHPLSKDGLAVGAVLDDATIGSGMDLDVVVAVGINYTQFSSTLSSAAMILAPDWRSTRMRTRLDLTLLGYLDAQCYGETIAKRFARKTPPFHLVAVNFFPWVTRHEWTELNLNAIAEALVLRCWGYDHPAKHIADLIDLIGAKKPGTSALADEIPFVVFHGANCAVPYLALETIGLLEPGDVSTNYVFCDNLSLPFPPVNAVTLLPTVPLEPLTQDTTHEVVDE